MTAETTPESTQNDETGLTAHMSEVFGHGPPFNATEMVRYDRDYGHHPFRYDDHIRKTP